MKISIGCDHSALKIKNEVSNYLRTLGHEINDHGTFNEESCDYTDFGIKVAEDVRDKVAERGILICYTGIGMSIIANKVKGVRCALVHYVEEAVLTREHNDSNCLALSAKYTSLDMAKQIISAWLDTPFSFGERHTRRVEKINKYEEEHI
ncbi:MAG: ribose 5-phosphate isomerase B [Anaeroplasmataceae bacterium]|nr:ribose 5-phosphate isomerase B [Anaeroplasmataceae bacterium]MDE6414870.1 ribose 5-phosphate isomerase B [Anaeroplasmataceae bacterium]